MRAALAALLLCVGSITHAKWLPDSSLYLASGDAGQIVIDTSTEQIAFIANLGARIHPDSVSKDRGKSPFSVDPPGFTGRKVGSSQEYWLKEYSVGAQTILMSAHGRYLAPIRNHSTLRVVDRLNPENSQRFGHGVALGFLGTGDVFAYIEQSAHRGTHVGAIQRLVVRNIATGELFYSRRFAHDFGRGDYGDWTKPFERVRGSGQDNARFVAFGQPQSHELWIYDHQQRTVLRTSLSKPGQNGKEQRKQFAFSSDGSRLAVFGQDARIVNTYTWEPVAPLQTPQVEYALTFSTDNRYLISTRHDAVVVFDTSTGQVSDQLDTNTNKAWANVAGTFVATAGTGAPRSPSRLKLWQLKYGKFVDTELCGAICDDPELSDPQHVVINKTGDRLMVYGKHKMYLVDLSAGKAQEMTFSGSQVSHWLTKNQRMSHPTQCIVFEFACVRVSAPGTDYWEFESGARVTVADQREWRPNTSQQRQALNERECNAQRDPNICAPHFEQLVAKGNASAVLTLCRESVMLCHEAARALVGHALMPSDIAKTIEQLPRERQHAARQALDLACWEAASLQACQHVDGLSNAMLHHHAGAAVQGTPHTVAQKLVTRLNRSDADQGWPMKRLVQFSIGRPAHASEGIFDIESLAVPITAGNTPDISPPWRTYLALAVLVILWALATRLAIKMPVIMVPVGVALVLSPILVWTQFPRDLLYTGDSPAGIVIGLAVAVICLLAATAGLAIITVSVIAAIVRRSRPNH